MAPPKKRPNIAVLERRLQNPFGEPSLPVTLKDDSYECRWFNSQVASDHIWRAKYKGWENVRPDELADAEQLGAFQASPEGFVVRGEKGQEVLMKMPADWRAQIQKAKSEANARQMRPGAAKKEVVAAVGAQFGEPAANFMQKATVVGDVVDTVGPVPPE